MITQELPTIGKIKYNNATNIELAGLLAALELAGTPPNSKAESALYTAWAAISVVNVCKLTLNDFQFKCVENDQLMTSVLEFYNKILTQNYISNLTKQPQDAQTENPPVDWNEIQEKVVIMGVNRRKWLHKMDIIDTSIILKAYNRRKIDEMEQARLIGYLANQPHLKSGTSLYDYMPLPNDNKLTSAPPEDSEKELEEITKNLII